MARSRKAAVPLAWRVPNAPATFVGRKKELGAVAAATRRGPLVVLCAAGGLGKTALACAAARGPLASRTSRAVMVGVRAETPLAQVLLDVARALGRVEMRSDADLAMHVIDLAEARGALVVLDDLHHVLPEATAVLVAIARYARRSSWIATSRTEPRAPELVGQIIRLGVLTERDLAMLARMVDASLPRAEALRIARKARGSPWKARQLAAGERHGGPDEASQTLLSTLSAVQGPISRDALAAAIGAQPKVTGLVRGGLVEAISGGYRLHEQARSLVRRAPSENVVEALAEGSVQDTLEALRLAQGGKDEDRALAICAASFDRLLRGGYAPTLWTLLAPHTGARWSTYKLRAAMQLADLKITTLLDEPAPEAMHDRLLWVRALLVESKAAEALAAAEALCTDMGTSADAPVLFWAWLEHAMAARHELGPEEGLARLERANAPDGATRALAAALRAFWLAEAGRIDESIRVLDRSAAERAEALDAPMAEEILGGPIDFFVRYYRMAAFMECGHLDRAHDEIASGRKHPSVDVTLRASYVQLDGIANLSIARGELDQAAGILARLLRGGHEGGTYHTIARLLDIERRMAAGAFADVPADLDRLLHETRAKSALVHAWCIDARERLHVASASREEPPLDIDASPLGAVARSVLVLRRALRRARFGQDAEVPEPRDVEGAIVHALVAATRALVGGHDPTADARRAVELAARHGWALREQEARTLLAEALLVSGDVAGARGEVRGIARRASAMPSARFELDARLLATLLDDPPLDAAVLEELAWREDVSPMASRRARALLGETGIRLDKVDERIISAARARAAVDVVRVHARPGGPRGWGLDARRRTVWLPDGRRVSFARHALLVQVLEVLGRHGGSASFDALAREVWQRRDFHPLHDGNRMRVTLHRLRSLVEDDPRKPQRVVLGASSYELGPEPFTLVARGNAK